MLATTPTIPALSSPQTAQPATTSPSATAGGGGHQPLKTTIATMTDRQAAISMASMPLAFQHAIMVTRRLGFRYIWIDSLCIIQDSKQDWKEQAAKMQHVYEGAILTIAADAGDNSTSGLTCTDKRKQFRGVHVPGEVVFATPVPQSGDTPAHFIRPAVRSYTRWDEEGSALQRRA